MSDGDLALAEEVENYDVVFLGVAGPPKKLVDYTTFCRHDWFNYSEEGERFRVWPDRIIRFQVEEVWSGDLKAEEFVYSNYDDAVCGYIFTEGHRYLIFTKKTGHQLNVSFCSATQWIPTKEQLLERGFALEPGESDTDRREDMVWSVIGHGRSPTEPTQLE